MKDLTELRCSDCNEFIGALGQMYKKKVYCYKCAHKLGYWITREVDNAIRIVDGKTVSDPTRHRKHTETH